MADIGFRTAPAGSPPENSAPPRPEQGTPPETPSGGGQPPQGSPQGQPRPGSNVRDFNAARRASEIGRVQQARRRRRAGNYLIYYILLGIILTVVCVTLSMTVFFNISTITASGSSVYTSEQILAAVDAREGDNLLRLNVGRLEERALEQLVSAESVDISRKFPDSLEITVTDGVPSMQVGVNGVYYLFSDSGRLIGQSQAAAVNAQVLVGPDPSGLSVGQYLDDLTEEQQLTFTTWRTLMGMIDKYGINDISAMDLSDEMSLKIFYQNRLEIDLGPLTDMDAKIAALKAILYDSGSIGVEETGVLNLENADRSYFNNQSACTLPTGAGQLGWSWADEYSETLMQSLFGLQETPETDGAAEEGDGTGSGETSGTTSESGDAASSGTASSDSSAASSEESSESYATSDGMRLPQMPSVGGTTSSAAASAPASDTSEPSTDTGSSEAGSSAVSEEPSASTESTDETSETSSGLTGAAGSASSGGSTGAGVGSQAPSVPGIGG